MTETPQTPPGFYPDSNGVQRYWDGQAWSEQTQEHPVATASTVAASSHNAVRPWYKKKRVIIPGALAALLIVGSAAGSGSGGSDGDEPSTPAASSKTSDATKVDATEKPKAEKPKLTSGQKNALRAAENYLSFAPFSRNGMVQQLSSAAGDGYPKADAEYAADHVEVDYKEQAAKAAKNYLEMTPFSRSGMIQQLSSAAGDQYTKEQAEYGATKAGL
jgi:hypothetical protein